MRKNELFNPKKENSLCDSYELVVRWLLVCRRLERACLFAALGLSVVPAITPNSLVSAISPWVSMAALSTAITADFIRGFLSQKADYYYDRIKNS